VRVTAPPVATPNCKHFHSPGDVGAIMCCFVVVTWPAKSLKVARYVPSTLRLRYDVINDATPHPLAIVSIEWVSAVWMSSQMLGSQA